MGSDIKYFTFAQADPLPRMARIGVNINAGVVLSRDQLSLRMVSFERLLEAEDLLVIRYPDGDFKYKNWLGDINIWDHVIRNRADSDVVTKKGWELSFFEFISFLSGRYKDPLGRVIYNTGGIGFSLSGLVKGLLYFNPKLKDISFLTFISHHLDVQYNSSKYKIDKGHPLAGTKFEGITISIY